MKKYLLLFGATVLALMGITLTDCGSYPRLLTRLKCE